MDQFTLLLGTLTGIATAFIIGTVKAFEEKVDVAFVSKLGNLTPVLVIALSFALPKLWAVLHLSGPIPDAQVLASTPIAGIISILAREALVRVKGPAQ